MKNTKLRSLGMCVVSIMAILAHSALGQKRDAPTLNPPGVEVRVINTRAEAIPVTGTVNVGNLGSNPLPVTGTVDIGNLGTLRNADNPVFLDQFSYEADNRNNSEFYIGQFQTKMLVVESISAFIDVRTSETNNYPPALVVGIDPSSQNRYVFYPTLATPLSATEQRWFFNPKTRIILSPGQNGRFYVDTAVDRFNVVLNGYYIEAPPPAKRK